VTIKSRLARLEKTAALTEGDGDELTPAERKLHSRAMELFAQELSDDDLAGMIALAREVRAWPFDGPWEASTAEKRVLARLYGRRFPEIVEELRCGPEKAVFVEYVPNWRGVAE